MAGTILIPGAERITPSRPGGIITSTAPPRVVWHTTEADPGTASVWAAMIRVLKDKSAEPQVLYDPVTDRLGQFMPLNLSGRALRNDGSTLTNRVGKACIQIEVIGRSAKPFTDAWKPGKNFAALMAAIRSWGIADVWPAGPPPRFVASPPHNVPESPRSRTIWLNKGGHYSHSQIPGNDHGDPGAISISKLFAAGGSKPTPPAETDMPLSDADKKFITNAAEVAAHRWALWGALYGIETADEVAEAQAEFEKATAAGLSPEQARLQVAAKLSALRADLKAGQAKL